MPFSRRRLLKGSVVMAMLPWMLPGFAHSVKPLRIGVLGAGTLGATVGRLWCKAGYEVMFASRHPEQLRAMAQKFGSLATVGLPAQAAEFGSVLLLAVPYVAVPTIGRELQQLYSGKIVLDSTNPWGASSDPIYEEARNYGVAQTVAKYMPGARIVRAFSCVDATVLDSSVSRAEGRIGMPIASNDANALQIASQLVHDAGCDPVVTGDLNSAVVFEQGGPGWRADLTASELRLHLGLSGGN